ncbi:MFS transporter [Georgenia sp. AZ-5]|uniref:MFS transporter n=1 Tax=Georgenia sp. AZ-5 TaxID=3367526 RepID=UPI0037543CB7
MSTAGTARLWTKHFILATGVNFLLSLIFYLLVTTLALYAVERFGASDSEAGLASSAFVIGAMVSRLFAGAAVDRVGRRRMVLASLVVFAGASLLYLPADELGLLLAVRFVHGVAFGSGNTALAAAVQGLIPGLRRGEGTGYFAMSGTLATAVGPFVALLLVDGPGYEALFTACAAVSVLAMLLALTLRLPEAPRMPSRAGSAARGRRSGLHLSRVVAPAALPIAAVMLGLGIAYSGVVSFLNSYADQLGLGLAASAFFLVYAVVVLVSRPLAGRLQDHRGDNAVIYPALASFAAGLVLLALAGGPAMLVAAGAFVGLGYGTLMSAAQVVAIKAAPKEHLGRAISTFCLLADAGAGVGPLLLGLLLPVSGYSAMYLVLAAVVVASAGAYHLVHGRAAARTAAPAAERAAADVPAGTANPTDEGNPTDEAVPAGEAVPVAAGGTPAAPAGVPAPAAGRSSRAGKRPGPLRRPGRPTAARGTRPPARTRRRERALR